MSGGAGITTGAVATSGSTYIKAGTVRVLDALGNHITNASTGGTTADKVFVQSSINVLSDQENDPNGIAALTLAGGTKGIDVAGDITQGNGTLTLTGAVNVQGVVRASTTVDAGGANIVLGGGESFAGGLVLGNQSVLNAGASSKAINIGLGAGATSQAQAGNILMTGKAVITGAGIAAGNTFTIKDASAPGADLAAGLSSLIVSGTGNKIENTAAGTGAFIVDASKIKGVIQDGAALEITQGSTLKLKEVTQAGGAVGGAGTVETTGNYVLNGGVLNTGTAIIGGELTGSGGTVTVTNLTASKLVKVGSGMDVRVGTLAANGVNVLDGGVVSAVTGGTTVNLADGTQFTSASKGGVDLTAGGLSVVGGNGSTLSGLVAVGTTAGVPNLVRGSGNKNLASAVTLNGAVLDLDDSFQQSLANGPVGSLDLANGGTYLNTLLVQADGAADKGYKIGMFSNAVAAKISVFTISIFIKHGTWWKTRFYG